MYISSEFMGFSAPMVPSDPIEEQVLLQALADGDPGAREQLVERKLPLAVQIAGQLNLPGLTLDDKVQLAAVGLLKALDRYDPCSKEGIDELILADIRKVFWEYREKCIPEAAKKEPAKADLCEALELLDELERAVLTMRLGLNGETGRSQEETAQHLGISAEEVSRIFRRAQIKVRKYL